MRYIPHTEDDIKEMLSATNFKSTEELFRSIPMEAKLNKPLNIPPPLSESELLRHITELGSKNSTVSDNLSFLGAGSYNHYTPAAVGDLISRSEWLTPYTPYQPELSQGTLQAIFEYQTMICSLTGMDVTNASHYDGATATAEAALMAIHKTRKKDIIVSSTLHPEYREVIKTILRPRKSTIHEIPFVKNGQMDLKTLRETITPDVAGVIIQTPNFFGVIEDLEEISQIVRDTGALFIVTITEPVSLGLLEGPGAFGADIVTAEGQSFGCGLNYGGPALGIFAALKKHLRSMPGRIAGETIDKDGNRGFVLTLSTREQHIRREKATSNICSNEALLVTAAAIHLSLLGKEGLKKLAEINLSNAEYLKDELSKIPNIELAFNAPTFNEFVIRTSKDSGKLIDALLEKKIFAGSRLSRWYPNLNDCILMCTTECHNKNDLDTFIEVIKKEMN